MSPRLNVSLAKRQEQLWGRLGSAWLRALKGYRSWLTLEKSLAPQSIEAYLRDVFQMGVWITGQAAPANRGQAEPARRGQAAPANRGQAEAAKQPLSPETEDLSHAYEPRMEGGNLAPEKLTKAMLREWLAGLSDLSLQASSQARMLSAVKSFYLYLEQEGMALHQPAALLELPRRGRKLPTVLSVEEVNRMLDCVDMSAPEGHRNRCMLELMYACGLRVSELVHLKRSDLQVDLGLIMVRGKGSRERLVPLGTQTARALETYLTQVRLTHKELKGHEDAVFLSKNGRTLTRMVVFLLVKKQAALAGITKVVGPHTFRHAFATHMVEAGADLRAVQEMLGHQSILTTEIYTHLSRDYLREVVQKYHPLSGLRRL